jgi:transposase-like protein
MKNLKNRRYTVLSKRFEEKLITTVLKEEAGMNVQKLCCKYDMSDNTFYRWKAKHYGLILN